MAEISRPCLRSGRGIGFINCLLRIGQHMVPRSAFTNTLPWSCTRSFSSHDNTRLCSCQNRLQSRMRKSEDPLPRAAYTRGKAAESHGIVVRDAPLTPGSILPLSISDQSHLKARRLGPKSVVTLLDGRGGRAVAEVTESGAHVTVLARSAPQVTVPHSRKCTQLAVCFSPPKSSSRADWAVEKLTEVGVHEILLMTTQRSVVRDHPSSSKLQRWSRLSEAAVKQSMRLSLPQIKFVGGIPQVIAVFQTDYEHAIVLSPDGPPLLTVLESMPGVCGASIVLIAGPEGGLTQAEEAQLQSAGCVLASMGSLRLRVETAVVVACATVSNYLDANGCPTVEPSLSSHVAT